MRTHETLEAKILRATKKQAQTPQEICRKYGYTGWSKTDCVREIVALAHAGYLAAKRGH